MQRRGGAGQGQSTLQPGAQESVRNHQGEEGRVPEGYCQGPGRFPDTNLSWFHYNIIFLKQKHIYIHRHVKRFEDGPATVTLDCVHSQAARSPFLITQLTKATLVISKSFGETQLSTTQL